MLTLISLKYQVDMILPRFTQIGDNLEAESLRRLVFPGNFTGFNWPFAIKSDQS
jgi:hypothetical protein